MDDPMVSLPSLPARYRSATPSSRVRSDLARHGPGRRAGPLLRPHGADIDGWTILWFLSPLYPPDTVPQRPHPESDLTWLATVPDDVPALYCGRTELISMDGRSYGFSPLFTRPIAFRNALIQSLGGGNTMVFNKAAKRLLEVVGRLDVVLHDWWMYQLVSAVGGAIRYDPQPALKYRQHLDNLIGSNLGWRARFVWLRMLLSGRFRDWNRMDVAALQRVPAHLIKPQNSVVLQLFAKARTASLLKRLYYLKQSGVYRQTLLGNIGLLAATLLKRI